MAKSESKLRTQPVVNEGSQRARPVLPMAQPLKAEGEAKDLKAEGEAKDLKAEEKP